MSREILFRGKRLDNDKWIQGMLCRYHEGVSAKIGPNDFGPHEEGMAYCVSPFTVGQYTGLKDKNGKRIFEGDILSTDLSRPYNIVEFRNGAFMLQCEDNGYSYRDIFFACDGEEETIYKYAEVIGNIYDNPDLIST